MDRSADASSTSPPRPSRPSPRSARASPASGSPGSPALGFRALRDLARRHGIRPTKTLGQNFLADPNLARRIVALAETGPGDRVLDVGAGMGSLTIPLAETGAEVLAVEFDRAILPALSETVAGRPNARILAADATEVDWAATLGEGPWTMVSNLPYNIAVPVLMELLERAPQVRRYVVIVQRELGERLTAAAGDDGYGAASVKVAYRAQASVLRRVPASVFWPRPSVESVVVGMTPHPPPVPVPAGRLFKVVDAGFAERRKTMRNALRRLGLGAPMADDVLVRCGVEDQARAETLTLQDFACIADAMMGTGAFAEEEGGG